MNARPTYTTQGPDSTVATAALATFIALGILSAVAFLFLREGKPLERLAAAERACAQYSYQSERQACMKEWLAGSQPRTVARR